MAVGFYPLEPAYVKGFLILKTDARAHFASIISLILTNINHPSKNVNLILRGNKFIRFPF